MLSTDVETHKATVRRLIDEVINDGRLDLIDEIYTPRMAAEVRAWIAPFRESFPDVEMAVVDLVAEGNQVVGRFLCSGTHTGRWRDHPPIGRRFERVDEVYFFTFDGDRIAGAWGIEDTLSRLQQLGLA